MKNAFGAVLLALAAAAQAADPQQLLLRAQLHFDEHGAAQSVQLMGSQGLSEAFQDGLRSRLLALRVPAQQWDGKPADFRTGAVVKVEIQRDDQGSGTVTLRGVDFTALPLDRRLLDLPSELAVRNDYDFRFSLRCEVNPQGRCLEPEVLSDEPLPQPVRQWAVSSVRSWRFIPQRLAGQAVSTQVYVPFRLKSSEPVRDAWPVDFRGVPPMLRAPSLRP